MRLVRILAISAIVSLTMSCLVTSIHPLYTEKDLIFVTELLGTWAGEEEEDIWTFNQSGKNAYELVIRQQRSSKETEGPYDYLDYSEDGEYEAHLVKLGKFLFLDIYPDEPEIEEYGYDFHLVPVHSFWRIWIEKDVMRLAYLSEDWLEEMLNKKKVNIAHIRLEDRVVLAAPTEELQKFVLKYAEDSDAFPEPEDYLRKKK